MFKTVYCFIFNTYCEPCLFVFEQTHESVNAGYSRVRVCVCMCEMVRDLWTESHVMNFYASRNIHLFYAFTCVHL